MKASKFSDAQKAFILKQGDDGVPVTEICRKAERNDRDKGLDRPDGKNNSAPDRTDKERPQ